MSCRHAQQDSLIFLYRDDCAEDHLRAVLENKTYGGEIAHQDIWTTCCTVRTTAIALKLRKFFLGGGNSCLLLVGRVDLATLLEKVKDRQMQHNQRKIRIQRSLLVCLVSIAFV